MAIIAEWRVPGIYGKTDAQKVCNELLELGDELEMLSQKTDRIEK